MSKQLAKERAESVIVNFGWLVEEDEQEGDNFACTSELEINKQTLKIKAPIVNIWLILENALNLRGKFALNEFAGRGEVLGGLPWNMSKKCRAWSDNDNQGLCWYFEKTYCIISNSKVDAALSPHSERHKFNDVMKFLASLMYKYLESRFWKYGESRKKRLKV